MAIFRGFGLCHVVHSAGRAGAGLVASAAFAVHRANKSGSEFFALAMWRRCAGLGFPIAAVLMVVPCLSATSGKTECKYSRKGKHDFFHDDLLRLVETMAEVFRGNIRKRNGNQKKWLGKIHLAGPSPWPWPSFFFWKIFLKWVGSRLNFCPSHFSSVTASRT